MYLLWYFIEVFDGIQYSNDGFGYFVIIYKILILEIWNISLLFKLSILYTVKFLLYFY